MIEPFTARTPQADLEDLRQRLATTRWAPEQPAGRDEGAYGFPLSGSGAWCPAGRTSTGGV